jgi:radical SAM family uncharacterized protein/radical SAM-linked protein
MQHPYTDFIHEVKQPARYLGGEYNSRVPDHASARVSMALGFPDVYDIGMSHLGTKILYKILGDHPDIAAERVFCPWSDLEAELRARSLPLVSLETARPLAQFDVVGFSLQYELTYSNVLTMLELGGIPLRAADRNETHPLVIGGGPTATHPEPVAPFFDAFLIGDGEEKLPELLLRWAELRDAGLPRTERLIELAKLGGIYCPALYATRIDERGGFEVVREPLYPGVPERVERAILLDINRFPFPDDSPVAVAEAIFDRMSIEIARGCTEGCRFCQAGMIYRPVRERSPEQIVDTVVASLEKGGYDEVSLTSLSTADYSCISPLIKKVMQKLRGRKVSLGVSSLRAYGLDEDLLDEIADVRATGLTFAPEAGTQRMRDVVNKNISEEDILATSERVFSRGWQKMKFYFMIGLPGETDEDVAGIAEIARKALDIGRRAQPQNQGRLNVNVSVSSHVPKPHTPFQWAAMDEMSAIDRKQQLLAELCRRNRLNFRRHDMRVSHVEGIFSRGDRRIADLLERVWRAGARFDGWDEHFRWDLWQAHIAEWEAETGVSRWLFLGTIPTDAALPWDHISVGLEDGFLAREWRRAMRDKLSPPCGKPLHAQVHHTNLAEALADQRKLICYNCGVACDMQQMRDERLEYLQILGAEQPPGRRETSNRQQALARIARGEAPRALNQGARVRYRLRHTKLGKTTLQGHLDLVREMPRIFRRAGLDVYYSEGYHPHPQMSFGPAPQLGMHSIAEVLDVDLTHELPPAEVLRRLNAGSPEGLVFTGCRRLGQPDRPLSKIVRSVDSTVILRPEDVLRSGGREALEGRIRAALEAAELPIDCVRKQGKVKRIEARPCLERFELWDVSRLASFGLAAEGLPPGIAALAPWTEAELALYLRQAQSNDLQPRVNELVAAVTGLQLGPDRTVRLAVLAELSPGILGDPLQGVAPSAQDEAQRSVQRPVFLEAEGEPEAEQQADLVQIL